MLEHIWNPWHGCRKISEGCRNCYMYYLDKIRDKDGSVIYKTKTKFKYPLQKNRDGEYKLPSGALVHVCMVSDFFLEEADEWRKEAWDIMAQRPDLKFWLQTKRAERVKQLLPDHFAERFPNVSMCFSTENQEMADKRIPYLLDLPIKEKNIMCAPMISHIDLSKYLSTGMIRQVLVDGENYEGKRPLYYEWVKDLYDQCQTYGVLFDFCGTGNVFVMNGRRYNIPKAYQRVQAIKSGLQIPPMDTSIKVQYACSRCSRIDICNGCRYCGECK